MKAIVLCATLQYDGKLYRKGDCVDVDAATARQWEEKRYIGAQEAGEKPLDKMKVEELIAYAQAHGIDLGDAKRKDDILVAISAAQDAND